MTSLLATRPYPAPSSPGTDTPVAQAAGWHGLADIQTLAGLGRSYLWPEPPYYGARITLQVVVLPQTIQGTYQISIGPVVLDRGDFWGAPVNAAGPPMIILKPGSPSPRYFRIDGIFTDSNWRIYVLALTQISDTGTALRSFTAFRFS